MDHLARLELLEAGRNRGLAAVLILKVAFAVQLTNSSSVHTLTSTG